MVIIRVDTNGATHSAGGWNSLKKADTLGHHFRFQKFDGSVADFISSMFNKCVARQSVLQNALAPYHGRQKNGLWKDKIDDE